MRSEFKRELCEIKENVDKTASQIRENTNLLSEAVGQLKEVNIQTTELGKVEVVGSRKRESKGENGTVKMAPHVN